MRPVQPLTCRGVPRQRSRRLTAARGARVNGVAEEFMDRIRTRDRRCGALRRLRLAALGLALLLGAACDDGFGPRVWADTPDTLTIYSITRPELLGRASGVDLVSLRLVVLESSLEVGGWDFALGEQDGEFVILPQAVVPGLESRAGIARVTETSLDQVLEAPADPDVFQQGPLEIEIGQVYVLRSRRTSCELGTGVYYGKMKALALDEASGTLKLEIVRNPYCNDRSLIPPEDDV